MLEKLLALFAKRRMTVRHVFEESISTVREIQNRELANVEKQSGIIVEAQRSMGESKDEVATAERAINNLAHAFGLVPENSGESVDDYKGADHE